MKKYSIIILCLMGMSSFLFCTNVQAMERSDQTNVGISFLKEEMSLNPTKPVVPSSGETFPLVKPSGKLPSTGELVTSVMMTFIGLSLVIIFVGIYSLRRVMISSAWEGV
ncbi:hypothetical protein A5821_002519 [Enterococcus sp. 7F3_DIV0205]|uniref:Gram-positive cocci surface proteins LPxTG domain-containing protein n=1 Tax=Candidatus Enterococcus palustris TaxID=1834189 RepID=A0AAQ3WA64_9ENTE|nr:hypothetical protein [Enterococcus sp. 7F3_DIV0205]OTN82950.1 hypothetical protein A5821_002873 [Enterococcus sp. 7F3_DIV0205]